MVFGAGELDEMSLIEIDLSAILGGQLPFPRSVESLTADHCDRLAQRYLDYIDNIASSDAQRVTDKMPTNFLRLGLITQLFPQARIIHCMRDPLDTCLSCYFQFFSESQSFTYDLANLGAYYRQYQRLMEHWRTVLSAPIMEVRYEDLVANQEGVSRALVDFCGLEWDDRCLRFHEMRRKVATASYDQVRQPMYNRSVGRWRHYESHLTALHQALNEPSLGEKQAAAAAGADPNVIAAYEIEQRGFEALQADELDQAKALYSEASRLAPEDDEAWYMLGTVNGRLGLLAEAEKCLRRAVALQPRHAEAHFNLGRALEGQGQREEALIHYQEAVRLKPDFTPAHAQTGNLLQALGRYEDALASHRETVRLSPQQPEAHYNLGNALQQTKRYAEAVSAYRQAIWLKPDFAEAQRNLSYLLSQEVSDESPPVL
jgi:tetratricopeptide (TPR) repeat protein